MEVTVARGDEPIVERLGLSEVDVRTNTTCGNIAGSSQELGPLHGDKRVSVQEGDTCQIPPHTDHWMEPDGWMEIVLMYTHPTN